MECQEIKRFYFQNFHSFSVGANVKTYAFNISSFKYITKIQAINNYNHKYHWIMESTSNLLQYKLRFQQYLWPYAIAIR